MTFAQKHWLKVFLLDNKFITDLAFKELQ